MGNVLDEGYVCNVVYYAIPLTRKNILAPSSSYRTFSPIVELAKNWKHRRPYSFLHNRVRFWFHKTSKYLEQSIKKTASLPNEKSIATFPRQKENRRSPEGGADLRRLHKHWSELDRYICGNETRTASTWIPTRNVRLKPPTRTRTFERLRVLTYLSEYDLTRWMPRFGDIL